MASSVAEIAIQYKAIPPEIGERIRIEGSRDSFEILKPYFEEHIEYREAFYVIYTSRVNRMMAVQLVSLGGVAGTVVDTRIIFQAAILMLASGIVLAHNHPSGNLQPSTADLSITRKIKEECKNLDMTLLDHLVMAKDKYLSFSDEGLI